MRQFIRELARHVMKGKAYAMRANPNELLPQHTADYVREGSQLTVTIGRNVGTAPLGDDGWAAFQDAVRNVVTGFFAPTVEFGPFYGTGEWEGVTEESALFVFITRYPGSVSSFNEQLAVLAKAAGQDAIAWSFGPNILATP